MIGQKLSERYEIVSELGRGGMGVVYRALDSVLNREVAIKVSSPAVLTPEIEQRFAAGYRETPRLSTYYAAFNIHRGPLADAGLRRRIVQALDVARIVQNTMRQVAIPARGLIPPGLLGYEPIRPLQYRGDVETVSSIEFVLTAAVHPVFMREYSAFFEQFTRALLAIGVRVRPSEEGMGDLLAAKRQTDVDFALVQWVADYPDADTFVNILQTDSGFVGPLCGSREIDRLIERGRAETHPASRHAVYRRVEELIMQEARLLPLFHEQVYRFARPELEGLAVSYWCPAVAYEKLRIRQT